VKSGAGSNRAGDAAGGLSAAAEMGRKGLVVPLNVVGSGTQGESAGPIHVIGSGHVELVERRNHALDAVGGDGDPSDP
jgi:hypothetical protein